MLGNVVLEVDAVQTRNTYALIKDGGAARCGCAYCRNFLAQMPALFPAEVIAFFEACGIDAYKDAEVYEMGESRAGFRYYGGEYYFVCASQPPIDKGELSGGFKFTITPPSPLAQKEFRNLPDARCFNFSCEVPWVLDITS